MLCKICQEQRFKYSLNQKTSSNMYQKSLLLEILYPVPKGISQTIFSPRSRAPGQAAEALLFCLLPANQLFITKSSLLLYAKVISFPAPPSLQTRFRAPFYRLQQKRNCSPPQRPIHSTSSFSTAQRARALKTEFS